MASGDQKYLRFDYGTLGLPYVLCRIYEYAPQEGPYFYSIDPQYDETGIAAIVAVEYNGLNILSSKTPLQVKIDSLAGRKLDIFIDFDLRRILFPNTEYYRNCVSNLEKEVSKRASMVDEYADAIPENKIPWRIVQEQERLKDSQIVVVTDTEAFGKDLMYRTFKALNEWMFQKEKDMEIVGNPEAKLALSLMSRRMNIFGNNNTILFKTIGDCISEPFRGLRKVALAFVPTQIDMHDRQRFNPGVVGNWLDSSRGIMRPERVLKYSKRYGGGAW